MHVGNIRWTFFERNKENDKVLYEQKKSKSKTLEFRFLFCFVLFWSNSEHFYDMLIANDRLSYATANELGMEINP